jgi:hypothetical protein
MLARTLVAVSIFLPLVADAAEIFQHVPVPPQVFASHVVTPEENLELPLELVSWFDSFDPSLGTLTEVHFAYDYRLRLTIHAGAFGGGGYAEFSGMFELDSQSYEGEAIFYGDGSGIGGHSPSGSPAERAFDFAMTRAIRVSPLELPMSAFVGAPGQELAIVLDGHATVFVGGDATASLELLDGSSVTLRYVYEAPEPAAELAGLAAGAALLLVRTRARRHAPRPDRAPLPAGPTGRPERRARARCSRFCSTSPIPAPRSAGPTRSACRSASGGPSIW